MAANVAVTYSFTNGLPSVAANVNTDFSDITTWINTNAVHLDASKAFTAVPSGPATDPTTANQLTRKAYVDGLLYSTSGKEVRVRRTTPMVVGASTQVTITWEVEDVDNGGFIAAPSTTITIPQDGLYLAGFKLTASAVTTAVTGGLIIPNQTSCSASLTAPGSKAGGAALYLLTGDVITGAVTTGAAQGGTITAEAWLIKLAD
jgi:hypothetical protein